MIRYGALSKRDIPLSGCHLTSPTVMIAFTRLNATFALKTKNSVLSISLLETANDMEHQAGFKPFGPA